MTMARVRPLAPEKEALRCADMARQAELRALPVERADASFGLIENGRARGWYSLWLDRAPQYRHHRTGCLGHFYADGRETALALLDHATHTARGQGMQYLLGPLDGDTWHSYRLTTETHNYPSFFLDTLTPLDWPGHFRTAGFGVIAEYLSTIAPAGPYAEDAAVAWQARFERGGEWSLRTLFLDDFEAELRRIYELSRRAFAGNFLYTPVDWPDFLSLYLPIRQYIRPELVSMAFAGDELAGFCLCLPDYAQAQRGEAIDTVILKTFARDPGPACKGLGAYLMWRSHVRAAGLGFKHLITAFMHADNVSLRLALKAGRGIRNYALFGRGL